MLEMVVFALTLVVAQTVAGLLIAKMFMSKPFIKKCVKMSVDMTREIEKMYEAKLEEEED